MTTAKQALSAKPNTEMAQMIPAAWKLRRRSCREYVKTDLALAEWLTDLKRFINKFSKATLN